MLWRVEAEFALVSLLRRNVCSRHTTLVVEALVMLLALAPQFVVAALTFSGDVILSTGSPSSPVMVGRTTVGSMQLDNGSTLMSGPTQFGTTPTGIGTGLITGPRTSWTMNTTDVGLSGIGRLDITQGAVADTTRLGIGLQTGANGTVRVDGAGSMLQIRGPLMVGSSGSTSAAAMLEVLNGAIVNATQTTSTISRSGRVVLNGGLLRVSTLTNEGVISGSGEVQLITGATFNQPGRIFAGEDDHLFFSGAGNTFQNIGLIEADGGEIEIGRPVNNAREGTFIGGEITLRNGTVRVGGTLPTTTQPQLTNSGLIAAIGGENHFYGRLQIPSGPPTLGGEIAVTNDSVLVFHDDVTLQGGMFTVFAGSKATLLEDLALTSGSLLLADISGSSVDTEYGEIEVVGNVQLGGSIRAIVSDSFTPEAGDSFKIITALGGVSGQLTLADMPQLPNRLMWDLDVGANQVALNVVQAPPGDYNTDGSVDAGDYVVWRRAMGQMGSGLDADGNSDGVVDSADYDHWRANFGSAVGSASPSSPIGVATSVPEPGTGALLVLGAVAVAMRRARPRIYS